MAPCSQEALDLVVGIVALPSEVTQIPNGAALTILIFSTYTGEKDHFSGMSDRYDLREKPFCPWTIIIVLLFEAAAWSSRLVSVPARC